MRIALLIALTIFNTPCFSQIKPGFDEREVLDMIAICNSYTFLDIYNTDATIIPKAYKKIYTSGVFGMDNKFQLFQKDKSVVINLRGSTDKKVSWLENIYSAMIPASGTINISGEDFNYCFARDTNAAVHGGYALAMAYLHKDILYHIFNLNRNGIYDFIITGHSQGGALANILRAYLENLSDSLLPAKNNFKTIAFAAPMIGNKAFATEYNTRFSSSNTSFNIVNPEDPVPNLPTSYNDSDYLADNMQALLSDKEEFNFRKMLNDGLFRLFEDEISNSVKKLSYSAFGQISKALGPVIMPEYVDDFNYQKLNKQVEILPVEYPKLLKDSSILQNDSLMAIYTIGTDGYFTSKELYIKEPWAYQHKPYNYYVSILKLYFPERYALLKRRYLPENL
jgi:hypothetical protein